MRHLPFLLLKCVSVCICVCVERACFFKGLVEKWRSSKSENMTFCYEMQALMNDNNNNNNNNNNIDNSKYNYMLRDSLNLNRKDSKAF